MTRPKLSLTIKTTAADALPATSMSTRTLYANRHGVCFAPLGAQEDLLAVQSVQATDPTVANEFAAWARANHNPPRITTAKAGQTCDAAAPLPTVVQGLGAGDVVLGDERLGSGSFGTVWAGRVPATKQAVAVKVCHVDDKTRDRLASEVRLLHAVWPALFLGAFFEHSKLHVITRVAIGGAATADNVSASASAEDGTTSLVQLLLDVSAALSRAHRLGAIHGDVKPANVVLSASGEAWLIDWGEGHIGRQSARPRGSRLYRAPESTVHDPVTGEPLEYGREVDMWALGITLVELATGEHPVISAGVDPCDEFELNSLIASHGQDGIDLNTINVDDNARTDEDRTSLGIISALVDRLLSPDPGSRPAADDIPSLVAAITAHHHQVISDGEA